MVEVLLDYRRPRDHFVKIEPAEDLGKTPQLPNCFGIAACNAPE